MADDILAPPVRVCTLCLTPKPHDEFYHRKGVPVGRCKGCVKADNNARYHGRYRHCATFKARVKAFAAKWHEENKAVRNPQIRDRDRLIRLDVIRHYGGECRCCGERRNEFLAIDHVAGGGRQHRLKIGGKTHRWLKRDGYPDGFRVLCHNCNMSLGAYGYCPHGNLRCEAA